MSKNRYLNINVRGVQLTKKKFDGMLNDYKEKVSVEIGKYGDVKSTAAGTNVVIFIKSLENILLSDGDDSLVLNMDNLIDDVCMCNRHSLNGKNSMSVHIKKIYEQLENEFDDCTLNRTLDEDLEK